MYMQCDAYQELVDAADLTHLQCPQHQQQALTAYCSLCSLTHSSTQALMKHPGQQEWVAFVAATM
jgi:hypothetical protein